MSSGAKILDELRPSDLKILTNIEKERCDNFFYFGRLQWLFFFIRAKHNFNECFKLAHMGIVSTEYSNHPLQNWALRCAGHFPEPQPSLLPIMSSVMEELPDFHFEGVLAQIELFVTIHVTDTYAFLLNPPSVCQTVWRPPTCFSWFRPHLWKHKALVPFGPSICTRTPETGDNFGHAQLQATKLALQNISIEEEIWE